MHVMGQLRHDHTASTVTSFELLQHARCDETDPNIYSSDDIAVHVHDIKFIEAQTLAGIAV